jgi:hypothetical protein
VEVIGHLQALAASSLWKARPMELKNGLGAVEKKKISYPFPESILDSSIIQRIS